VGSYRTFLTAYPCHHGLDNVLDFGRLPDPGHGRLGVDFHVIGGRIHAIMSRGDRWFFQIRMNPQPFRLKRRQLIRAMIWWLRYCPRWLPSAMIAMSAISSIPDETTS
jgi:hypothetical protein